MVNYNLRGKDNKMKVSKSRIIFNIFNYTLLTLIAFACVYPIIYVTSASFSGGEYVTAGKVWFLPKGITLDAYKKIMEKSGIWVAYANSFYYMIVGTIVNLAVTICGAYPLSKKRLIGRRVINLLITFSMWFSAGLIPTYLVFKDYGLINTRAGIIVGFACSAYYFILLRTYFINIPDALEEAAAIDGAKDIYILCRIYIPLALPSLATIGLFYAISRWNGYLWAMILLKDENKIPLQVLLKKLVVDMSGRMDAVSYGGREVAQNFSEETVMYATMVFSILPMILIYPLVQRFFIKGMLVGSVKG